ncbi:MAG: GNAT family N-acetyltransferase, partial [Bacteroidota bacterium]
MDNNTRIVNFKPEHIKHFYELNKAWIERYFFLEALDKKMLEDPEAYILEKGGYIFIALYNNEIAGTCALIPCRYGVFELAKMAVSDLFQGKGIGYALGMHCIAAARMTGMRKIELLSNTVLTPAINLYRKLGFQEVPLPQTGYQRANIKMELDMQTLLKISIVVDEAQPSGLVTNAVALISSTIGNRVKFIIGSDARDRSGTQHAGLPWLPMTILKADQQTLQFLRRKSEASPALLKVDVSEHAQQVRIYEAYTKLVEETAEENLLYTALGFYGDRQE